MTCEFCKDWKLRYNALSKRYEKLIEEICLSNEDTKKKEVTKLEVSVLDKAIKTLETERF